MKVLVYWSNALGNFIMFTPTLVALRAVGADPLDVLVGRKNEARWNGITSLVRCYAGEGRLIDSVIESDQSTKIEGLQYDAIAVPWHGEPSPLRDSLLAYPNAVTTRTPDWRHTHEVEHYLEMPRRLGFMGSAPGLVAPLCDVSLAASHDLPDCIAIGIGSATDGVSIRKRWAVEKWRELAELLHYWTRLPIAVVGGPGEAEDAVKIGEGRAWCSVECSGDHVRSAQVLMSARYMVTVDTYTMHLAASVGTPTVSLWGPSSIAKNRPWTKVPCEFLRSGACRDGHKQPCQPGDLYQSCRDPVCMQRLEVPDVMAAVRRLERKIAADDMRAENDQAQMLFRVAAQVEAEQQHQQEAAPEAA